MGPRFLDIPPHAGTMTATLRVRDVVGGYTIPYIRSGRELRLRAAGTVRLFRGAELVGEQVAEPVAVFADLAPGEYAAEANGTRLERLGIGTVIAALGDSLTEGYHGRGFWRDDLELSAADFPADVVSRDGRNFPQYAPTTATHQPQTNCFASWLPALNDLLSAAWGHPVFVANEGWGGHTSGQILARLRHDENLRARLALLRPTVWLIHLGVNDERARRPAADVAADLAGIVDLLAAEFGAAREKVYVARPSYDYWPGAAAILREYLAAVDAGDWRRGPDFFAAFARDRRRWYGDDPVHPGPEGMDYMARLWFAALTSGCCPSR